MTEAMMELSATDLDWLAAEFEDLARCVENDRGYGESFDLMLADIERAKAICLTAKQIIWSRSFG